MLIWMVQNGAGFAGWILSILGSLILWMVSKYISKNDILNRAIMEIGCAVKEVFQTYVMALKEAAADGKLTEDEKKAAKDKALAIVKEHLGVHGLATLGKVLGVDVEKWLGAKIEAAVYDVKATTPLLKPTSPK